ncbi:unnamed protein product [Peronospora belbahrii]|uniref:PH domain-containing protein n=1 Tax=Peronospora belbahrii TaxID=622444 RepID=A0AAU9LA17_9STRA|nr:unnamed protein product [Peronospora belbahrii]CAH0519109.1 unnamed protein product [Peronospora belbahrii]
MALYGVDGEYAGWVYKQGSLVKNWKKRFMVLHGRQLTYYNTAKVTPMVKAKGSFQVITVELSTDIQNGLLVHGRGGRVLKLYTASAETTSTWYNMILEATMVAPQQFMSAPPDRLSTLSTNNTLKSVNSGGLNDETVLRNRVESLSLTEDSMGQVTHSGWLKKEGARVKSWKRRYFVLRGNALSYFDSEDTGATAKGHGHVRAVEVNDTVLKGLDITFDNGRVLRVSAKDSEEMELWLCKLSDAIEAANAEQNNVRQSLAVRNSLHSLSIHRPSPTRINQQYQQQQSMQHNGKRHSIAVVPSKPMGIVVKVSELPQRHTMYGKQSQLSSGDSCISSGLSSQFSASSSYNHSNSFPDDAVPVARPVAHIDGALNSQSSSGSTLFDSDDEYDSDDSEGDWI